MMPCSVRRLALAAALVLAPVCAAYAGDDPALAIQHQVFVTTDVAPDSCDRATETLITVEEDTPVRFCFKVRNIGDVTLTMHDLVTDTWGKLDSMLPLDLAPGETAMLSQLALVTDDQTTTSTWIARDVAPTYTPTPTTYDFTDISTTGTELPIYWVEAQTVTMPFPLRVYGKSSLYINVCNAGVIELDSFDGFCYLLPSAIPTGWEPYSMVPFWADLGWFLGGVYTQVVGDQPHRRQIVQWQRELESQNGVGDTVTFQVIISEGDDRIVFQYPDVMFGVPGADNGQAAIIGMNYDANLGQQYSFFSPVLQDGQAILWTPNVWRTTQASASATVIVHTAKIDVSNRYVHTTQGPDHVSQRSVLVGNEGQMPLRWNAGTAPANSTAHIPTNPRPVEITTQPEPLFKVDGVAREIAPSPLLPLPPAAPPHGAGAPLPAAYGREDIYGDGSFVKIDLATGDLTFIARAQDAPISGVQFLNGDYSRLYSLTGGLGTQSLIYVSPDTGAMTIVGSSEPGGNQAWSGITFDSTNGMLYGSTVDFYSDSDGVAYCGPKSTLWRVNPDVGTPRRIGTIDTNGCIMGIATNANGEMFGVDTQNDTLLAIDKTTGAGSVIGPIGFDAKSFEGLDFDEANDVLYLTTLNLTSRQGELRTVDVHTGGTTLATTFQDPDHPGDLVVVNSLALESGNGGCVSPASVPWLSMTPAQDTLAPGAQETAVVRTDSTGLAAGSYNALLCLYSNDPRNRFVTLPVQMDVIADALLVDGFD